MTDDRGQRTETKDKDRLIPVKISGNNNNHQAGFGRHYTPAGQRKTFDRKRQGNRKTGRKGSQKIIKPYNRICAE
jgi:hypothetical protein